MVLTYANNFLIAFGTRTVQRREEPVWAPSVYTATIFKEQLN